MSGPLQHRALQLQREIERLRQEQETFEQLKRQDGNWFYVRLAMACTTIVLLLTIVLLSSYVIVQHESYSQFVVQAALTAILVDVLGMIIAVYKIALNPQLQTKLAPVTQVTPTAANESAQPAATPQNPSEPPPPPARPESPPEPRAH